MKSEPKFKKGDRCVYLEDFLGEIIVIDNDFVINGKANWYSYENHPKGGYWQYPIVGKANDCPEDFLLLYNGQQEGDAICDSDDFETMLNDND